MVLRNDGPQHQDDGEGGRVCAVWAGVWVFLIRYVFGFPFYYETAEKSLNLYRMQVV